MSPIGKWQRDGQGVLSHRLRYTAEKIRQRIALIRPLIYAKRRAIPEFRLCELPDAGAEPPLDADAGDWPTVPARSFWGRCDLNFLLRSELAVPWGWDAGALALHLPLGKAGDIFTHPEALVYVDGQPFGSADRYHDTLRLPAALADGRTHALALHGWTGLDAWPPNPDARDMLFMGEPAVVELDTTAHEFITLAETALDVATQLDEAVAAKHRVLTALDQTFLTLDTRDPLGDAFHASVGAALGELRERLAEAGAPLDVTLHAIGHAHMDIAYLWPISQIRRKNGRTYSNVLRLMDQFPDYRFSHSQPQLYRYTETDYPEIFEGIRARVASGQWEPMGGMWVEPDTNIPGPEALVRQLMLGRRYFRDRFGDAETPVLWLPDTFGFSWCLPQLMAQAGLTWFVTNKVNWNQYSRMPASTTWWQGIDGTRVLAHFLTTPRDVQHLPFPTNYKSDLSAAEVIGTWTHSTSKARVMDLPICYGYGDGGGGPTETLIRKARIFGAMPGAPRLRMSTIREFFETLEAKTPELPVWNDEIYLEGHRGVFTSQGWLKRANRKAENLLAEAEFLAVLTGVEADLREAWELLCLHQFHDTIAGTAITQVFDEARADYDRISELCEGVLKRCVNRLGPGLVAVNALPVAMPRVGLIAGGDPPEGVSGQTVDGGTLVFLPDCPAYAAVPVAGPAPESTLQATAGPDGIILENHLIRVELDALGEMTRIFDKEAAREVLAAGQIGNRLQAFEDRPISWDAWDIDVFFEDRGEVVAGATAVELVETGPIRAAVRIERRFRSSTITQHVRLHHHSKRIDFDTEVDWHETHTLLKVAFPVAILAPTATYEIQWGVIERPTHRNTPWDYAKFEVPAQRWADLGEGGYGVALLNDCKYGYDIRENVVRLSLIKSATMPDPVADQGRHVFTYALLPHTGDWRNGVPAQAMDLNRPLRLVAGQGGGLPAPPVRCAAENVVIETLKPAEDGPGFVVRLYEAHRRRGLVTLEFGRPVETVRRCTLLEDPGDALPLVNGTVTLDLRPFEIVSLMCS
ncbi:MAG: glycoside hydrolase family 38 C-terminal domain-containing protein [Rhodobacter sp.]|nr:glycoside hydrolase family 38 C-terminal domain-containing protein [Rhodobacter sp.]